MAGGGNRAIIAAFFANLGIAVAKLVGFTVTRSSSMLAEGIHSLADTGNQGLLLLGGHRAKKAPTPAHPFGYGRERYFWAFVVSVVLFTLGGLFSIYEGIEKILHPHEIESAGWAFGILILGVLLESWSFRTAVVESNTLRGKASWSEFIRHSKVPELPVVLLEDLGALIGLVVALTAVTLSVLTSNGVWDGIGAVTVGSLLCLIAVVLASEMKSLLIGEAATAQHQREIRAAIEQTGSVDHVIHLRTQHLGPDELLVAVKVEFAGGLSVPELAAAVDELEAGIRAAVPIARVIYVEPDMHRSSASPETPSAV